LGEARTVLWTALGDVQAAHAVMLRDASVFDDAVAAAVLTASDAVARAEAPPGPLSALVTAFDDRSNALVSSAAAGAPGVGRTRAELAATALRVALRAEVLELLGLLDRLRLALLDLAVDHVFTLMPAYGQGRPLQATSFAHWLGGAIGPLGRASTRVRLALAEANQSPMGAGALASTGLGVDREAVADVLGFDGPVPNTLDALAATDYLSTALDAAVASVNPVGRLLDEFRAWLRTDPDAIRLDEAWIADADPAVPQFRPAALLDSLSLHVLTIAGNVDAVDRLLASVPYGPVGFALDDLAPRVVEVLADARSVLDRAADLVSTVQINRAHLANRAGRDFTTASELADFIMIEEGIDPESARAIAAMSIRGATEGGLEMGGLTPQIIDGAALLVIGRELGIEIERFGGYLAPRRVLERRSATGSPNPETTRDWLEQERTKLLADVRWRNDMLERLRSSRERLEREVADILSHQ
jgi:argininosuccinate lyase